MIMIGKGIVLSLTVIGKEIVLSLTVVGKGVMLSLTVVRKGIVLNLTVVGKGVILNLYGKGVSSLLEKSLIEAFCKDLKDSSVLNSTACSSFVPGSNFQNQQGR